MKPNYTGRLAALGVGCLMSFLAQAQDGILQRDTTRRGTVTFLRLAPTSANRWESATAQETLQKLLKLQKQDELRLQTTKNDELGFTHSSYQQYYNGTPVEYGTYVIHARKGVMETLNGEVIPVRKLDTAPSLSEKAALASALTAIGAKVYSWQVSSSEGLNSAFNKYPAGELLISRDEKAPSGARLAYKFAVYAQQPASATSVYVDAHSGQVFRKLPLLEDVNVNGAAGTTYSGTRSIVFDQQTSGGIYRLRETGRGSSASCGSGSANIETYNANGAYPPSFVTDITSPTSFWRSGDAAYDAHWAGEQTYDYFRNRFCRNSFNGSGATITLYTHSGMQDNAGWDPNNRIVILYDGNTQFGQVTCLDVTAHEIAHGYTQSMINLDRGQPEPWAINEGLSDIWGACVEQATVSNKQTWLIAEDIMRSGFSCLRNLANPNSGFDPAFTGTGGYPDSYQGSFYDTRAVGNNYDPHINATVIGHCFYLIAAGGSGTSSAGRQYDITGIGMDESAQILFRAENMGYITSGSGFASVRTAMIQSATELFGSCSAEVTAVTNAWYAVGVGSMAQAPPITGPNMVCASTTFQVNAPTASWVAAPANLFTVTSGTGAQFSTAAASGAQGTGTITATLCGGLRTTKYVTIGRGDATGTYSTSYYSPSVPLQSVQFVPNNTQYTITLDQPYDFTFTSNTNNAPAIYVSKLGPQTATFYFTGRDVQILASSTNAPCTISGSFVFSSAYSSYYTASPNPASTELNVSNTDNTTMNVARSSEAPVFEAELYDYFGYKVKSGLSKEGKMSFDVHDLPSGVYTLRVGSGKNAYVKHIQVVH